MFSSQRSAAAFFFLSRHRCVALVLFFLDNLFRRVGDELLIRKFRIDPLDVGVRLGDLLAETRLLRGEIDHAFQRQRRDFVTNDELDRATGRLIFETDVAKPRQPLDNVAPSSDALLGGA